MGVEDGCMMVMKGKIYMNKKLIGILIAVIVLVIGVLLIVLNNRNFHDNNNENNNNNTNESTDNNNENNQEDENTNVSNGNILVVYFSAQGHTESVAEQIAANLNADLFEIIPVSEYTSDDLDWTDDNSRVSREHEDESLRNIELETTSVSNWDIYDTVLIGYPIWWGIAAWPVNTFVEANNFTGKTVIPFCTSSSSGLGESGELLAELANSGNWQAGHRFSSNPSDSDIKTWTDTLR